MTQSSSATSVVGDHSPLRGGALKRGASTGFRMLAAVALIIGGAVAFAGLTDNTAAVAADNACDGVIVVVDFTDLGGDINMVCVDGNPPNGSAALQGAGFKATETQPGFICAINTMPDPCPETFDGSFWSYWNATPDSEWLSYQVGADSSTPAHGSIEGWRYNDGTTPPGLSPAEVVASFAPSAPDVTETAEADPDGDNNMLISSNPAQASDQMMVLTVVAVGFLVLIVAIVVFFAMRRRRDDAPTGGPNTGARG